MTTMLPRGFGHLSMPARRGAVLLAVALTGCGTASSQAAPGDDASGPETGGEGASSAATDGGGGDLDASGAVDASAPDGPRLAPDAGTPADGAADALADAPSASNGDAGVMRSVYVTFYGWADNSPPGGAIAYPKNGGYPTVHDTAGGTGTYADPITFATDQAEIPVGTIVYVPFIEKYVVMEDDCVECDSDWTSSGKWHIDLWMNSGAAESTSSLTSCEGSWTRSSAAVEIGAPPGRTVTTTPLFDPATNMCRTTP